MSGVFFPRGLANRLAASSGLPVQILEGRRAVGKTTLLQNLTLANGERPEYFSFSTDRESLRAAKRDPQEWLSRLPKYSVIDEAQLLPDVTQHVKSVVDPVEDKHRFILCGSAGIGRARQGEADWLAGRAQRLELLPFSASELTGHSLLDGYSLVDALFHGDWASAADKSFASSDADLIAALRYGGMPSLCIPGANPGIVNLAQLNQQVLSENEMSLGRELVPGQAVDILRARALLDALLAYPGGILNKDRLANELKMDVRTVGRYLDILTERFLVYSLANFRGSAASVGRGAPKMHAVDTSTVCESLSRRGHDITSFPASAGQVLENWVANQIRAEIGWASTSYQLGYWRVRTGNRDDEVDLVLLNDTSGAVGVEVKLTSTPKSSHFRGLRRFREDCGKVGRKFRRGFVVCTCERVKEIEDGMWAIPYQLLGDYPAPSPEELGKKPSVLASQNKSLIERISLKPTEVILSPGQKTGTESPAATIFVSYAHADNETVYGGLLKLVEKIADQYEMKTGETLSIFTDRNLKWGQSWKKVLRSELETTAFLLSFVSPRYLKSRMCREEVERFATAAEKASYKAILPILIQAIPQALQQDSLWKKLQSYQYEEVSVTDLRSENRQVLDEVADKISTSLQQTVESRQELAAATAALQTRQKPDEPQTRITLEEILEGIQEVSETFNADAETFGKELDTLGDQLNQSIEAITVGEFKPAIIAKHARLLDPQANRLEDAASRLTNDWGMIRERINGYLEIGKDLSKIGEEDLLQDLSISLEQLATQTRVPELDTLKQVLPLLGRISRLLRPTEQSIMAALRALESINTEVVALRDYANQSRK
ncbi:DUF4143 domain-containing protein [Varibaculum cambriense]|uniref:DUF4143 domain-containing protein n=1 Tax=Varibaculum cambriense TaxID=184870 RepID=UPI00241EBD23|nr:AAA family ATPase [Varibaculum cambriense]MBS5943894.1 AAA family ATPase [Varibaculum cambriense]MDU7408293.1 AAA family ATPase [Varibaculum cambriense]